MILFYITISLLVVTIGYSIYENRRNNLKGMIYEKQNEFGNTEIELKERTYGKYGVAVSIVAMLLFTPSLIRNNQTQRSIFEYDQELFQMVEVNAGEYLVNMYGEGFSFGVNVLFDNSSVLLLDNLYPYYEGLNRYHTANELIELNTFSIDSDLYAEITVNDDYKW